MLLSDEEQCPVHIRQQPRIGTERTGIDVGYQAGRRAVGLPKLPAFRLRERDEINGAVNLNRTGDVLDLRIHRAAECDVPGLSAISGNVQAAARKAVYAAEMLFTSAGINHIGIAGSNSDSADGEIGHLIGEGRPGGATIYSPPHAAVTGDENAAGIVGIDGDAVDAPGPNIVATPRPNSRRT
ncbi:hypothetical protein HRbin36_01210 [bacterium HR36]|nr:hypothetical protein HRbin36_01210 [bacterium HR36]